MASKSFGGTVKLTGESEYQKALRGISDNLKVLNSEMKLVTSQYDKNDTSSAKLNATSEVLNKKIAEQENKVSTLKDALAKAESETGKNSNTTKKWQVQLNEAEAELNEMNKELKDQHGNLEESGEKALKLGDIIKANLISDAITSGIKALGGAIKAVGSAFVDLGKQAVASYAEYEQLVGGVETLFGEENANKVKEYANNAYTSAGMSANQYMETVTSFSASLIQSLDGDTALAAEVANRAITDMSDNANKMGTDIQMIQNAYQGFAKQNYTMLDNLKLGYGGTKAEMERLIADAATMTDVQEELGIAVVDGDMSFANIANAISIVQAKMGLLGTTTDEAYRTISGSTGSMKAAWQNLVTGIADENADFEKLVNNLVVSIVGVDGVGGVVNNMLPRIQQALDGIVQMVVSLTDTLLPQVAVIGMDLIMNLVESLNENMPALLASAEQILQTLIDGVMVVLPDLIPMVMQILGTLITTIVENLPLILDVGCQVLMALVMGIADMLPSLIPTIVSAVALMVTTLIDNIDLLIDAGVELIIGLADGLILCIPTLIECIPVIISKLIGALVGNAPKLTMMGVELTLKLVAGLIMAIPDLVAQAPALIYSLIGGLYQGLGKIGDVGLDLVKGLWEGIKDAGGWILDRIKGFGDNILSGIKGVFGIHSPSTVFRDEVGKNLALGLGEGFGDTMSDVTKDMENAIPTEFDANMNVSASSSYGSNYDYMVSAFKQALKDVKVVMNNREMGAFVTETMERVVYS